MKKTTYATAQRCYIDDEDVNDNVSLSKYRLLPEKESSSACSTPISKVKARIKFDTPGVLHRSDSTEYCSILSPNRTTVFAANDDSYKARSCEKPTTQLLSRSFTPKSYKPLHIKVPEYNLDSIKPLLKEQNGMERSTYNFDIKNYSLPSTPIARSNKLRKNAWLSGDVTANKRSSETDKEAEKKEILNIPNNAEGKNSCSYYFVTL